jgi:alpha-beta hydrolase superfamily lysophospholipase
LIALDLFASCPQVGFDRMVLFAPALKLHARSHLIRLLAAFPSLVIPTLSPPDYLANRGTPMAAYAAVFDTLASFRENIGPKINVPTLVFIAPRDELVSANGLRQLTARRRLDRWRIVEVQKDAPGRAGRIRHLIIDEAAVGKANWRKMTTEMLAHLKAAAP